ncbi:hypothetical protein [Streptomyces sp. CBMA156]|uniref:hypothetical protein n=1 Tax=Streptomyces sp. CBMA156 TaxID=1930280 RepID=UPI001661D5B4|nr:hypothetical protein [Streptomyces sp. CBMA156]MBD0672205.1 hypothetical protein [Streptomyces sp. CBMA156]
MAEHLSTRLATRLSTHRAMLFARPRLAGRAALAAAGLTALQLGFGSVGMSLPGAYDDSTLQLRMVLAAAWAGLAAGSLHSGMSSWEAAGGRRVRRAERAQLLAAVVVALGLSGGAELIAASPASAVVVGRALLIWWGIAVLSGRLLGRQQAWVLPVATIFPLSYLGWDGSGSVRWWNWPWAGPWSAGCWVLVAVSLAVGAAAWWLTPWRWRALTRRR